jgi:hypothetical protein
MSQPLKEAYSNRETSSMVLNKVLRTDLSTLTDRYSDKVDLFICSISFEQRSLSIANSLDPANIGTTLVCCNRGLRPEVKPQLMTALERFAPRVEEVTTEMNDPLSTADSLLRAIEHIVLNQEVSSCLVDITTFTHEALLILLKVLEIKFRGSNCRVDFIYTAAAAYSLDKEVDDEKWLARGIGTVRSVLGYAGFPDPTKKTHLVILTGFETERSMGLIDILEPNKVSLGVVREDTAVSSEHHRVNQLNFNQLSITRDQVSTFTFSCTDPTQTGIDLQHEIELDGDYNVVIAALNTKLSTVGVGLFAMEHPQVQLCYATANAYNTTHYSIPGDFCYIFTKQFSSKEAGFDAVNPDQPVQNLAAKLTL